MATTGHSSVMAAQASTSTTTASLLQDSVSTTQSPNTTTAAPASPDKTPKRLPPAATTNEAYSNELPSGATIRYDLYIRCSRAPKYRKVIVHKGVFKFATTTGWQTVKTDDTRLVDANGNPTTLPSSATTMASSTSVLAPSTTSSATSSVAVTPAAVAVSPTTAKRPREVPKMPAGARSAFELFCAVNQETIKTPVKSNLTSSEIVYVCRILWDESPEEQEEYKKLADEDKLRYQREKEQYDRNLAAIGHQGQQKKKKRDPNAPAAPNSISCQPNEAK